MITKCVDQLFHLRAVLQNTANARTCSQVAVTTFCALLLVVASATVAPAQTYTDLYNFGTHSGGTQPRLRFRVP